MAALTPPAVRCIAFGRRIETTLAVPGAIPDDDRQAPEIVIRSAVPRSPHDETGATLRRDGATLHFTPPGVAEYCCTAGTIDITPHPGAAEDAIAGLLIATALPGLLWLRGGFMLHAAAVVLPGHDRAVAIAASSGTGKSTMLAELVARGARVLADDSVCLRGGGAASGAGIEASGLPGGYYAHDPDPAARRFVPVAATRAVSRATLGAILVLSRDEDDAPAALSRLSALEAMTAVLLHRHRPAIPALFGDPARRLADAVQVAGVPTYRWRRRTGSIRLATPEWQAIDRLS